MASGGFLWDIIECPRADCDKMAESVPMYRSASGVHYRIFCLDGHVSFDERQPGSTGG